MEDVGDVKPKPCPLSVRSGRKPVRRLNQTSNTYNCMSVTEEGRGASIHEYVVRCVASEIDSLCQSALVEKITYRSVLAGEDS
jgi:hypothetical protein